jgi:hypothetical protein
MRNLRQPRTSALLAFAFCRTLETHRPTLVTRARLRTCWEKNFLRATSSERANARGLGRNEMKRTTGSKGEMQCSVLC